MNQRRRILTALGLGMALASMGRASQAADKVYHIACLVTDAQKRSTMIDSLKKTLRELGYIEGQNVIFDAHSHYGDLKRLPGIAAEIVAQKPDVIVAASNSAVLALSEATAKIPIVMALFTDPVRAGIAASLAHPGGNVTGMSNLGIELTAKKIELIRLVAPGTTRIGAIRPNSPGGENLIDELRAAAKASGVSVQIEEAKSAEELEKAFSSFAKQRVSAVIMSGGAPFTAIHARISALAIRFKLITVFSTRPYVDAGGLLSYGPDVLSDFESMGGYVDKILKGAKPGDLPIRQPTKFELIINRKTANALGITLGPELLLRADDVIQ